MKPVIGAVLAVLATCGDHLMVGDLPDGGVDDAGQVPACAGSCFSAGSCAPAATVNACGTDAGMCIDCAAQVAHASLPSCNAGTCDFLACEAGWSDCDGVRSNGCERNVPVCYEILVDGEDRIVDVQTDGTDVYWLLFNGTIRKVPTSGGTPVDVISGAYERFRLHGASLFLAMGATISVMPKAGGTPVLVTTATNTRRIEELVTDGVALFWLAVRSDDQYEIGSAPTAGGPPIQVVGASQSGIGNLTLIDGDVWFQAGEGVLKVAKTGGPIVQVANLPGGGNSRALLMGDTAYFGVTSNYNVGGGPAEAAVFSMPYGASTVTRLVDLTYSVGSPLADGATLYVPLNRDWVGPFRGQILRLPMSGGPGQVIVTGVSPQTNLVSDATSLYWRNSAPTAAIFKTAKLP